VEILPLSIKLGIILTPRTEIIGELQSRKCLMMCKARRFGKLSRKKTFQKEEEPLKTNGYLRSSETVFLEQDCCCLWIQSSFAPAINDVRFIYAGF
jgi:hypothetical protein